MTLDILFDIVALAGLVFLIAAGARLALEVFGKAPRRPLADIPFGVGLVLLGTGNFVHALQHQARLIADIDAMVRLAGGTGPASAIGRGLAQYSLNQLKFGSSLSISFLVAMGIIAWGLIILGRRLYRQAGAPAAAKVRRAA